MANVLVEEQSLQDIADAIREKIETEDTFKPSEMGEAIRGISSGGITPSGTIEITENGTYDVTEYASASVDVQGGTSSMSNLELLEEFTITEPSNEIVFNVDFSKYTDYRLIFFEVVNGTLSKADWLYLGLTIQKDAGFLKSNDSYTDYSCYPFPILQYYGKAWYRVTGSTNNNLINNIRVLPNGIYLSTYTMSVNMISGTIRLYGLKFGG